MWYFETRKNTSRMSQIQFQSIHFKFFSGRAVFCSPGKHCFCYIFKIFPLHCLCIFSTSHLFNFIDLAPVFKGADLVQQLSFLSS